MTKLDNTCLHDVIKRISKTKETYKCIKCEQVFIPFLTPEIMKTLFQSVNK